MLNIYDATIPPLRHTLNNLSHILKRGEAHAEAKS